MTMPNLYISPNWDSKTTGSFTEESPSQTLDTLSGSFDIRNGDRSIFITAIQLPTGVNGEIAYSFNKIKAILKAQGALPALGKARLTAYRYRHDNLNTLNVSTLPYVAATGYTTTSNVDSYVWTYVNPARIADGSLVKLGEADLLATDTGENVVTKEKDYQYHVETFNFGSKIDVLSRQPSEVYSVNEYPSYAYLILELRGLPDGTSGSYWFIAQDAKMSSTTANTYGRNVVGSSSIGNTFNNVTPMIKMVMDLPTNTNPTDITLTYTSGAGISETAVSGSTVGTLSATDAEGGAMTFSLVSGAGSTDNASFVIDGNALKTAVALDYETKSSYSIRVRATDSGSLTYEEQMTITVLNSTADDPVALVSAQLPVLASGKTVTSIAVDPRVVPVTLGGQALSEGSVIRNTVSGQKFMKSAGGVNAFVAIELTPKAAWSWAASANAAWEILQGF